MNNVTALHDHIPRLHHRADDVFVIRGMPHGELTIQNEAVEKSSDRLYHPILGRCELLIGFWRIVSVGRRNTFDLVLKTEHVVPPSRLLPDDQIEITCFSLRTPPSELRFVQPIMLTRIAARIDDPAYRSYFSGVGEVQCSGRNRLFPNDMICDLRAANSWGLRTPVIELS